MISLVRLSNEFPGLGELEETLQWSIDRISSVCVYVCSGQYVCQALELNGANCNEIDVRSAGAESDSKA